MAIAVGILLLGIAVTVLATASFIHLLASSKPLLVIDTDGVTDHSSLVGVGLVRWSEIVDVQPRIAGGQPFISIVTRDPLAVVARQRSLLKRWVLRLGRRMGYDVASITANVLPLPADDVLQAIRDGLDWTRS